MFSISVLAGLRVRHVYDARWHRQQFALLSTWRDDERKSVPRRQHQHDKMLPVLHWERGEQKSGPKVAFLCWGGISCDPAAPCFRHLRLLFCGWAGRQQAWYQQPASTSCRRCA